MEKSVIYPVDIEKLDIDLQSRVAQWAVLQDISLVEAKITRDPLIALPEALTLEHKCYTNFLRSEKNKPILEKILCNFQVAAFSTKSPDKLIMKIEASFCASYDFNRDKTPSVPDDSADDLWYFSNINPISDAWPYWREFVQSMSSRMGFPALTVPLLEIRPKKPVAKREKSQPAKKESTRRKKLSV
jgi:hypothetical protein